MLVKTACTSNCPGPCKAPIDPSKLWPRSLYDSVQGVQRFCLPDWLQEIKLTTWGQNSSCMRVALQFVESNLAMILIFCSALFLLTVPSDICSSWSTNCLEHMDVTVLADHVLFRCRISSLLITGCKSRDSEKFTTGCMSIPGAFLARPSSYYVTLKSVQVFQRFSWRCKWKNVIVNTLLLFPETKFSSANPNQMHTVMSTNLYQVSLHEKQSFFVCVFLLGILLRSSSTSVRKVFFLQRHFGVMFLKKQLVQLIVTATIADVVYIYWTAYRSLSEN